MAHSPRFLLASTHRVARRPHNGKVNGSRRALRRVLLSSVAGLALALAGLVGLSQGAAALDLPIKTPTVPPIGGPSLPVTVPPLPATAPPLPATAPAVPATAPPLPVSTPSVQATVAVNTGPSGPSASASTSVNTGPSGPSAGASASASTGPSGPSAGASTSVGTGSSSTSTGSSAGPSSQSGGTKASSPSSSPGASTRGSAPSTRGSGPSHSTGAARTNRTSKDSPGRTASARNALSAERSMPKGGGVAAAVQSALRSADFALSPVRGISAVGQAALRLTVAQLYEHSARWAGSRLIARVTRATRPSQDRGRSSRATARLPGQPVSPSEAGAFGATRTIHIYRNRKGTTYYYVAKQPNGATKRVIVQLPSAKGSAALNQATVPSSAAGQAVPHNVATAVLSNVGNVIVKAILAGGASIGKLMGTAFPLVPVLFGLILIAAGALLRSRRLRFASRGV